MSASRSNGSSSRGYSPPTHADDDKVHQIEEATQAPISYIPLEELCKAKFTFKDKARIRHNFDIPSSV